jgi:outer membrane lipoprotein SlyB
MNHKIAIPLIVAGLLSGCQTMEQSGIKTLIGAGVGGLAGSTIGGGNGNKAAIAIGALLGGLAGQNYGTSNTRRSTHSNVTVRACDHIYNAGERSSCERGVAQRNRERQQAAEQRAYDCGRYGRCN